MIKVFFSPSAEGFCWSAMGGDECADKDIGAKDSLRHSVSHGFDGSLVYVARLGWHRARLDQPPCVCSLPILDRARQRAGPVFPSTPGTDRSNGIRATTGWPRSSTMTMSFFCEPDRAERETRFRRLWR